MRGAHMTLKHRFRMIELEGDEAPRALLGCALAARKHFRFRGMHPELQVLRIGHDWPIVIEIS